MESLTDKIITGRMDRLQDKLRTYEAADGNNYESISFNLGHTTLTREVMDDGTKGPISLRTQINHGFATVVYEKFTVEEGKLTPLEVPGNTASINPFKRARILARVAFSTVHP